MKFVFALLVLAAVAYARPSEFFKETLNEVQLANQDIKAAAGDILKREKAMAALVASASVFFKAETALETAASASDLQNKFLD